MDTDIEEKVNRCYTCQSSRNFPVRAPLHLWEWPRKPWQRIHVDSADYNDRNLLLDTDAHSKWIEFYLTGATNLTTTIEN